MLLSTWQPGSRGRRNAPARPWVEALEARTVPTVVAVDDEYFIPVGQGLNVTFDKGVLINDFSTTNNGAVLTAALQTGLTLTTGQPVNVQGLIFSFNPNGSFQLFLPSNIDAVTGKVFN